jgi:hypothetical protein
MMRGYRKENGSTQRQSKQPDRDLLGACIAALGGYGRDVTYDAQGSVYQSREDTSGSLQ